MTMTMDHQSNRHLGGGMTFDHLPYGSGSSFNNPWQHPSPSNTHLYSSSLNGNPMGFDALAKQAQKPSTSSMSYPSGPAPSSLSGTGGFASSQYDSSNLVNMSQELLNSAQQGYSAPSASVGTYAPTSMSFSSPFGGVPAPSEPRRLSHGSSVAPHPPQSFSDALDASRSMVAMSGQDLTTPRNIYDARERDPSEGYGFPAPHSPHSSISGASYAGSYASYAPSVDSSVSDYGSQSDLESVHSRTLPRPTGLMASSAGSLPPPQSMMGQFNSKISSSTQKKHKCKVCDKRFTRPSSLQTHMYSHTGEKPYACDAEGCGRHFSVVSNLRRHRKVHKSDRSDHESPEGSWSSEK